MRKHDVRKWLHAVLDLLPVILIPVFMIYSHRHTIDSGSIEVPQTIAVDFNQRLNMNVSETTNFGITLSVEDNLFDLQGTYDVDSTKSLLIFSEYGVLNHRYFIRNGYVNQYVYVNQNGSFDRETLGNDTIFTCGQTQYPMFLYCNVGFYNQYLEYSAVINVFDLTQMFGVGNEPTIAEFNSLYSGVYPYTLSHKELVDYGSTIYNATDIMSQMTYQLYNSVDKYFNMGNVFNLNGVYDWFNLNIFNGSAPIYIFIVWQIVLYEFVMDLLFLLYGLFMWFIDMIEKLMEKPINSVR